MSFKRGAFAAALGMAGIGAFVVARPAAAQQRPDMAMGFLAFKCMFIAHPFRNTPEYDKVLHACARQEEEKYRSARDAEKDAIRRQYGVTGH